MRMEKKMFCFQCEQTAGCSACTGAAGVCGKKADTAKLQDKLTGALIGLARSTEGNEDLVTPVIEKSLELGGYSADRLMTGINGGNKVMTALC